jgi:hypothetical protein
VAKISFAAGFGAGVGVGINVIGASVNPPTINIDILSNQTVRFFGSTYPNSPVTIELNSSTTVATSTVSSSILGDWEYITPALAEGDYQADAFVTFSSYDSVRTSNQYFAIIAPIIPPTPVPAPSNPGYILLATQHANFNIDVLGGDVSIYGHKFFIDSVILEITSDTGYNKKVIAPVKADGSFVYTFSNLGNDNYRIQISANSNNPALKDLVVRGDFSVSKSGIITQEENFPIVKDKNGNNVSTTPNKKIGERAGTATGEIKNNNKTENTKTENNPKTLENNQPINITVDNPQTLLGRIMLIVKNIQKIFSSFLNSLPVWLRLPSSVLFSSSVGILAIRRRRKGKGK